jgi:hypothetical protein
MFHTQGSTFNKVQQVQVSDTTMSPQRTFVGNKKLMTQISLIY